MDQASGLTDALLQAARPHLEGQNCLVALSGGADSAVCAWAAGRLCASARAVHVDHGWEASPDLRSAAEAIATALRLPLAVLELSEEVPSEGAAREARYEALWSGIDSEETLVLGHTSDDLAETVLMNILRGAGVEGLTGIPRQRSRLVRPLLDLSRETVRAVAAQLGLPFVDDPANQNLEYLRVRIRQQLLPAIEAEAPEARAALLRLSSAAAEAASLVDSEAPSPRRHGDEVELPLPLLRSLPAAAATWAVRAALREARGPHAGTAEELFRVSKVIAGSARRTELEGGFEVVADRTRVVIRPSERPVPEPQQLAVPSQTRFGSWEISAQILEGPPPALPLAAWKVVFDAEEVQRPLTIRPPTGTDSIAISGGHKKVSDALAESGVRSHRRDSWPIVVRGDDVLWLPGVRRADLGWPDEGSQHYLVLAVVQEGR